MRLLIIHGQLNEDLETAVKKVGFSYMVQTVMLAANGQLRQGLHWRQANDSQNKQRRVLCPDSQRTANSVQKHALIILYT